MKAESKIPNINRNGGDCGVIATCGNYEYVSNGSMKKIEQDYKNGKIDQIDYDILKDQIQRMSLSEYVGDFGVSCRLAVIHTKTNL